MAWGTFLDIFGFPSGKKLRKTIFLVDFSRQSKWQNPDFSKFFFQKRDPYMKKSSLVYQKKILKKKVFRKSGFAILIPLKNQPEKWSRLFFYLLRTPKYFEMFLMPFYAPGPFDIHF
jgi:hypothetical protein